MPRTGQAPSQYILMRWQPEAFAEHPREVIFGQRTQRRQLAKADGVGQVAVDVIHQQPPLMSGQATFEAKPWRWPTWLSSR